MESAVQDPSLQNAGYVSVNDTATMIQDTVPSVIFKLLQDVFSPLPFSCAKELLPTIV